MATLKKLLASGQQSGAAITFIRPSGGWLEVDFQELWHYRELLYFFIWRDLKVRYKQTVIGIGWAIIQPFFTMVVFSLFFGKLARIPSDGLAYLRFYYGLARYCRKVSCPTV